MDHGHPDAWQYPLGTVFDESSLVSDRVAALIVTNTIAYQTALISVKVERGNEVMGEFIAKLTGE